MTENAIRTIKGPCFDCDDAIDDAWEACTCRKSWSKLLMRAGSTTAPTSKLDPEQRPNVPQGMM